MSLRTLALGAWMRAMSCEANLVSEKELVRRTEDEPEE